MTELDFVATSWHNIAGRGWVAVINHGSRQLPKRMMPTDLSGRYVRIDGKEYYVISVECRRGFNIDRDNFALVIRGNK